MTEPTRPAAIAAEITDRYHNRQVASVNDHEVRLSIMTRPYVWHSHPDSDECFLAVDGQLAIDFEGETVVLSPGDMLTVPKGVLHRTRPVGERSVNLIFERRDAPTNFPEDEANA